MNCDHVFCLQCIKEFRKPKKYETEVAIYNKHCPSCRVFSDIIIPSFVFTIKKDEKDKMGDDYKQSMSKIECKYEKKDMLVYLDPPYYGDEKYYREEFSGENHIKLAEMLKNVEGKFILSYNDCEYVRELYSGFKAETVERLSNLTTKYARDNRKYRELIIRNY